MVSLSCHHAAASLQGDITLQGDIKFVETALEALQGKT